MSSRTQPQRQQAELKRTPHQSDLGKPTTPTLWVNELIARYADATETGTGRRKGRTVKGEVNPTAKEGKLSFPPAHAPTCGPVPPRPRKAPRCRGSPTRGRRVASAAGSRPLRRKAAESRGRRAGRRPMAPPQARGPGTTVPRDGGSTRPLARGPHGRPVRPAAASGRWRCGPTPREAAPLPVILRPSNPAGRGPRHPPARGVSGPDGGVAKAAEPGRHTCTFLRPAVFCR